MGLTQISPLPGLLFMYQILSVKWSSGKFNILLSGKNNKKRTFPPFNTVTKKSEAETKSCHCPEKYSSFTAT